MIMMTRARLRREAGGVAGEHRALAHVAHAQKEPASSVTLSHRKKARLPACTYMVTRSRPTPPPPWGEAPNLNASM
jgi:hypothetical protein